MARFKWENIDECYPISERLPSLGSLLEKRQTGGSFSSKDKAEVV